MVDFMLNNMRCPADVGFDACLQIFFCSDLRPSRKKHRIVHKFVDHFFTPSIQNAWRSYRKPVLSYPSRYPHAQP